MHQDTHRPRGSRLAAALAGATLLVLGGTTTTAQAATPQLSIAVDDGVATARSGDRLGFTITVTNLGAKKVEGLRVSQTVPEGASVVSVDADGEETGGGVRWRVDLPPTETVTLRTTMALGTTPDTALRLATVACAQVSAKGPALVCASDSDQLPAGAAVEQGTTDVAAAPDGWLTGRTPWYLGGGAAAVVAAGVAALVVRRSTAGVPVGARSTGVRSAGPE